MFDQKVNDWNDLFSKKFYDNLNCLEKPNHTGLKDNIWQRGNGFKIIFDNLLEIKRNNFQIVETGTCRSGKWSDGASSILFTEFISFFGGKVQSVDIKKKNVLAARKLINNENFVVHHANSIDFLNFLENKEIVDLFYLDSYDVKWDNDSQSAEHHLDEFKIIEPFLNNCVVAVDDNTKFQNNNQRTGKGRKIFEYLEKKDIYPVFDDYILVYKF